MDGSWPLYPSRACPTRRFTSNSTTSFRARSRSAPGPRCSFPAGASARRRRFGADRCSSTATASGRGRSACHGLTRSARCTRISTRSRPRTLTEDPSPADPRLLSYRSGFWAMVEIEATPWTAGGWRLELRAELDGGGQAVAPVANDRAGAGDRPGRRRCIGPGHPGPRWPSRWRPTSRRPTCSSARSSRFAPRPTTTGSASSATTARAPAGQATIAELVGDDPRFVISRSPRRLGFYRNFERALAARAGRGRVRCHGRPGRLLASRQAGRAPGRHSAAPSSSTAMPAWSRATAR